MAVAYQSRRIDDYDLTNRDATLALSQAEPGDYLILNVRHDDQELRDTLDNRKDLELLEVFSNKRDDQLRAYLTLPFASGRRQ